MKRRKKKESKKGSKTFPLAAQQVLNPPTGKDEYDLAEFAAYDEENADAGAAAGNTEKKESEK